MIGSDLPPDQNERDVAMALRPLTARSNAKGLAQLAWHLALVSATTALVAATRDSSTLLLLALLLHGTALVFLFAPLHETIHRTAFRSRWLNDGVAAITGLVLLLPPTYFRAFHFAHHRHTQDPMLDPELAAPKPATLGTYLWQVSGLPYWRERITTMLRHARGRVDEPFIVSRQRMEIVREARWCLCIYVFVAALALGFGTWAPVLFWLAPAVLGQPLLRLVLLAEHTGCPRVAAMLQNSRTTRSLAWVRRLAWNMPYHAEHHTHPAIPFHALPAAHRVLRDRILVQAPGYGAVHRRLVGELGGSAPPRRPSPRGPGAAPNSV